MFLNYYITTQVSCKFIWDITWQTVFGGNHWKLCIPDSGGSVLEFYY